jgi:hypothetical protein
MFRYEKDMMPFIQEFFNQKFQMEYYVKEFKAGIGIADLVFAPKINKREYYFENFEMLYHTLTLFNRKNKKIKEDDMLLRFSKKKIELLIEKFFLLNLIEKIENNSYVVKSKLSPSVSTIYAVEAKLSDWKSGFHQALRYKNFAQKSFLAISSDFVHRVDKKLLVSNNIGLISVSPDKTTILFNPKKQKPNDEIAFYFSGENFTKKVYLEDDKKYCPQQWL